MIFVAILAGVGCMVITRANGYTAPYTHLRVSLPVCLFGFCIGDRASCDFLMQDG